MTAAGKARSARDATKHALRTRHLLPTDENAREFAALAGALPTAALRAALARRATAVAGHAALPPPGRAVPAVPPPLPNEPEKISHDNGFP